MKKAFFFSFLALGLAAGAQQKKSLRELLYSGRLKSDSNTVVRSSDDLAQKIDTATRKPAPPQTVVVAELPASAVVAKKPAALPPGENNTTTTRPTTSTEAAETSTAVSESKPAAPPKSNTRILKEYTDSLLSGLKTEVLTNKKIKKDTYYVIAEYEIGTDGTVTVSNVTSSPENALLQSELKTRMELSFPKLAPTLDSAGNPRKVKKKLSLSVTKD